MKRRMIWILLAGILVGLAISGLYKHFVTDRIMDGGNGMENPDAAFLLDGDHTYVDNDALWPVLEGAWESADDRWQADIGEESGTFSARTARPFWRPPSILPYSGRARSSDGAGSGGARAVTPDGASLGRIKEFGYEASDGEGSGTLELTLNSRTRAKKR